MAKKTDSKVSKKDSKSKVEKKNSKADKSEKKSKKAKTIGYCVRCKEKREMEKVEFTVTSRNMRMAKGTCSVCSTRMSAILGKAE